VSDNKLVEGLSGLATDDATAATDMAGGGSWVQSYAGVSKKGYAPYNPRKKNQDVLIMEEHKETGSLLLCVFDGHGEAGDGVSQFFKAQLPPTLFAHPAFATDIETAVTESTAFLEKNLLRDSSIDTEFSGTTAVITVTRGDVIICANIGDSRMTLGSSEGGKIIAKALTDDHKPDRPDEKARILQRGGRVFAVEYDDGIDGPPRVWLGHMDVPGLAMGRSLGDTVAHSAGVISDPEYTSHTFTDADKYLVCASDGLWEFMTDQEVIDIMATQTEPRRSVDLLIMEANGRWMKEEQVIDDTTVIVAHLAKPN
jgi:serine/threonine protein phosphatase PrpC